MNLNRVKDINDRVPIRTALISVADKTGLEDLILGLRHACPGIRFYSTGGSYKAIEAILGENEAKRCLTQVSEYTGQPEMQGGLVKTLDYRIYLGLLSETYNPAHQADVKQADAVIFDLVVVNLYPFQKTVKDGSATIEDARTHIDIGGPCMLRAGAKNYLRVASVCDPSEYSSLLNELKTEKGALSLKTRFRLAKQVFQSTADYDRAIAEHFQGRKESELENYYTFKDKNTHG